MPTVSEIRDLIDKEQTFQNQNPKEILSNAYSNGKISYQSDNCSDYIVDYYKRDIKAANAYIELALMELGKQAFPIFESLFKEKLIREDQREELIDKTKNFIQQNALLESKEPDDPGTALLLSAIAEGDIDTINNLINEPIEGLEIRDAAATARNIFQAALNCPELVAATSIALIALQEKLNRATSSKQDPAKSKDISVSYCAASLTQNLPELVNLLYDGVDLRTNQHEGDSKQFQQLLMAELKNATVPRILEREKFYRKLFASSDMKNSAFYDSCLIVINCAFSRAQITPIEKANSSTTGRLPVFIKPPVKIYEPHAILELPQYDNQPEKNANSSKTEVKTSGEAPVPKEVDNQTKLAVLKLVSEIVSFEGAWSTQGRASKNPPTCVDALYKIDYINDEESNPLADERRLKQYQDIQKIADKAHDRNSSSRTRITKDFIDGIRKNDIDKLNAVKHGILVLQAEKFAPQVGQYQHTEVKFFQQKNNPTSVKVLTSGFFIGAELKDRPQHKNNDVMPPLNQNNSKAPSEELNYDEHPGLTPPLTLRN